jgi:hypothetical protein
MKYTVAFSSRAEQQLAQIWLQAIDRQKVTDASIRIEELLRNDAEQRGESRPEGWRILIVGPLAAAFEVSVDDRKVTVLSLRYISSARQ